MVTAAACVKAAPLHQQFRQARDSVGDASCFVGREVAVAERPFRQVVTAVHRGQPKAVGVADFVAVGASLFDTPRRRKSAFWVA
jgi:hypothetical protein